MKRLLSIPLRIFAPPLSKVLVIDVSMHKEVGLVRKEKVIQEIVQVPLASDGPQGGAFDDSAAYMDDTWHPSECDLLFSVRACEENKPHVECWREDCC